MRKLIAWLVVASLSFQVGPAAFALVYSLPHVHRLPPSHPVGQPGEADHTPAADVSFVKARLITPDQLSHLEMHLEGLDHDHDDPPHWEPATAVGQAQGETEAHAQVEAPTQAPTQAPIQAAIQAPIQAAIQAHHHGPTADHRHGPGPDDVIYLVSQADASNGAEEGTVQRSGFLSGDMISPSEATLASVTYGRSALADADEPFESRNPLPLLRPPRS